MAAGLLNVPTELRDLINRRIWPTCEATQAAQISRTLVDRDRVQQFAPDEERLFLLAPPFRTPSESMALGATHWNDPTSALDQFDPEKTLVIASFGFGSETWLALDYRGAATEPRVIRLRWNDADPSKNRWVLVSHTFREFATLVGLMGGGESTRSSR